MNLVKAGGVEMLKCHFTPVLRTATQKENLQLEKQVFVPYMQYDLQKNNYNLLLYADKCKTLASEVLKNDIILNQNQYQKETIIKTNNTATFNTGDESVSALFEETLLILNNGINFAPLGAKMGVVSDILITNLVDHPSFRHCLDTVVENTPTLNVKLCEFTNNDISNLYGKMLFEAKKCTNIDINMTLLTRNSQSPVTADMYPEIKIHNFETNDLPVSIGEKMDMVLSGYTICNERNVETCLRSLSALVRDNGFVGLYVPTLNHSIIRALSSIWRLLGVIQGDLVMMNQAEWETAIRNTGLELVSMKSDGVLNTFFLCRKLSNTSPNSSVVIPVDDTKHYSWVTTLQEAIEKREYHDIWLVMIYFFCDRGLLSILFCK